MPHTSPDTSTSQGRMMRTSAGRQPVSRWNRTMSATISGRLRPVIPTVVPSSHRSHRRRLAGFGPATAQALDRRQAVANAWWHKLLADPPLEYPADAIDVSVHVPPGLAGVDHHLLQRLERQSRISRLTCVRSSPGASGSRCGPQRLPRSAGRPSRSSPPRTCGRRCRVRRPPDRPGGRARRPGQPLHRWWSYSARLALDFQGPR